MNTKSVTDLVRDLYTAVDAEVAAAGPRCDASGRCCRFKEWGHVLYLTQIEADVLLSEAPPYQAPVSPDFCPFQKENLCTAREPRPLGCRIYFCDPAYQEVGNRIMESALSKLKQIAREHDLDWRYAPLHLFLNESASQGGPSKPEPGTRIPLTMAGRANVPS
jgi:Fe-S-cluster containining protein